MIFQKNNQMLTPLLSHCFSHHPHIQQGGPLPNAEGNPMLIQQTNKKNVRFSQFLGDALDQE